MEFIITPWLESTPSTEADLEDRLTQEGLDYYGWSNDPFDVYVRTRTHMTK